MAQFTRLKKLTDLIYSPTNPGSEANIRGQVDGSVQEISDILYSRSTGKGASQVGIEGTSYADVQAMAVAFDASGSGTVPPANSVGNLQLATDVKVGSLATLPTLVKSSVTSAVSEVIDNTRGVVNQNTVLTYTGADLTNVKEYWQDGVTLKSDTTLNYTGENLTSTVALNYDTLGVLYKTATDTLGYTGSNLTTVERVVT